MELPVGLPLGRNVENSGGDEVGGFEVLEIPLGVVVAFGAVGDGLGGSVSGDFLTGAEMPEGVLGEALATGAFMGWGQVFRHRRGY